MLLTGAKAPRQAQNPEGRVLSRGAARGVAWRGEGRGPRKSRDPAPSKSFRNLRV